MEENSPSVGTVSKFSLNTLIKYITSIAFCIVVLAVLVAFFSGYGVRSDWWGFRTGLKFFRYSFYISALGLIFSLAGLGLILFNRTNKYILRTGIACLLGLVMVVVPLSWYHKAKSVPAIHDITTDTTNPPMFVSILPLRKDAKNSAVYGGPKIAEKQKEAYPDIQPAILTIPPDEAFKKCLDIAKKMGWKIVDTDKSQGRIEATDQTFWFGFKDDIVIRITPQEDVTRVDIRSESRVGLSDVGTNAKRVRRFLAQLNK